MYKIDSDLYDVAMKTIATDDVDHAKQLFDSMHDIFDTGDIFGAMCAAAALFKLGYMQGIRAERKRRKHRELF